MIPRFWRRRERVRGGTILPERHFPSRAGPGGGEHPGPMRPAGRAESAGRAASDQGDQDGATTISKIATASSWSSRWRPAARWSSAQIIQHIPGRDAGCAPQPGEVYAGPRSDGPAPPKKGEPLAARGGEQSHQLPVIGDLEGLSRLHTTKNRSGIVAQFAMRNGGHGHHLVANRST